MVRLIPCPLTFCPNSSILPPNSNSSLLPNSSSSSSSSNSLNSSLHSSSSLSSSLPSSSSLLSGHPSELPSLWDQARCPNSNLPRHNCNNFSTNSSRDKQLGLMLL